MLGDSERKIELWKKIRKSLAGLPTDADFESFCITYYPGIHRRFSSGMSREEKTNLLHQYIGEPVIIDCQLDVFLHDLASVCLEQGVESIYAGRQNSGRRTGKLKYMAIGAMLFDYLRRLYQQYEIWITNFVLRISGNASAIPSDYVATKTALCVASTSALSVAVLLIAGISSRGPLPASRLDPFDSGPSEAKSSTLKTEKKIQIPPHIPRLDNCLARRRTVLDKKSGYCVDISKLIKVDVDGVGFHFDNTVHSHSCETFPVHRIDYCIWRKAGFFSRIDDSDMCSPSVPPFILNLEDLQRYCNYKGNDECRYIAFQTKRDYYCQKIDR